MCRAEIIDFSKSIQKVRSSYLPARYQRKLLYDLQRIQVSEIPDICRLILFGSCARNQIKVGSDIDLLLITSRQVPQAVRGELSSDLAEEKEGVSTDLVFYTQEEFQDSTTLFTRQIKKDGITLWEGLRCIL